MSRREAESKERISARRLTAFADSLRILVICATIFGCFYYGFEALKAFAGKDSNATMVFLSSFAAKISLDRWFAYCFGIVSGGWGLRERHLRKKKTKYFSDRNAGLERRIDPGRSSSGLRPTGDTRSGD